MNHGQVSRLPPQSFLSQRRIPVFDQRNGNIRLTRFVTDDEVLAVGGNIETTEVGAVNASFKQGIHRTNREARSARVYFGGHDFVVGGEVERSLPSRRQRGL